MSTAARAGGDLLAAIVAATRCRVRERRARVPAVEVERRAAARKPDAGAFRAALGRDGRVNVIAECKRRSPSKGVLRDDYDPVVIASGYERAGAAALSVLTEPSFFDGAPGHLEAVRGAVALPLLRKDFVVDPYQVSEARALGADAVLLIASVLDDAALRGLLRAAEAAGLATLVEVHDEEEVARAGDAGAEVIGVNNRDLRTMTVSLATSLALVERIPDECVAVAESGIRTGEDVRRLRSAGFDAFLVGERFMTSPAPGDALATLLRDAEQEGR